MDNYSVNSSFSTRKTGGDLVVPNSLNQESPPDVLKAAMNQLPPNSMSMIEVTSPMLTPSWPFTSAQIEQISLLPPSK